jgi:hypothetical protein
LLYLPENLIVKVLVAKSAAASVQIVAKPCVLSDEMMKEFWVMKLINDSTAVKIPIETGNKSETEIEILKPEFKAEDRIIYSGNYGLADTAYVKIKRE